MLLMQRVFIFTFYILALTACDSKNDTKQSPVEDSSSIPAGQDNYTVVANLGAGETFHFNDDSVLRGSSIQMPENLQAKIEVTLFFSSETKSLLISGTENLEDHPAIVILSPDALLALGIEDLDLPFYIILETESGSHTITRDQITYLENGNILFLLPKWGSFVLVSLEDEEEENSAPALADISSLQSFTTGEAIVPFHFTNSGNAAVNCSISPSLPAGLTISVHAGTCRISGTPAESKETSVYTVTATSSNSSTDTATVSIVVLEAEPIPLVCPTGYIPVPGVTEETHGINVPEFCVMKYEAKNVDGVATSQPGLEPWSSVHRNGAIELCQALTNEDYAFDLISNAQWQSLARQIELATHPDDENLYLNWQNGSPAENNALSQGNAKEYTRRVASPDDSLGCFGIGSAGDDNCDGQWHQYKRTHILPNLEVIWDLAGNVWEFVKDDVDFNYGFNHFWSTSNNETGNACIAPLCTSPQGTPKEAFGPYGDYTYKSSAPYGNLGYAWAAGSNGTAIRGGAYDGDNSPGLFAISMPYGPLDVEASPIVGFRCVATPLP